MDIEGLLSPVVSNVDRSQRTDIAQHTQTTVPSELLPLMQLLIMSAVAMPPESMWPNSRKRRSCMWLLD
jgi:lambda repressor-like predicted transcriptional regulator